MAALLALVARADIDVIGAVIWLALALGRVLPFPDLLGGFGSEAVLLVGAMMAVAEGLRRAGATRRLASWLVRQAASRPTAVPTAVQHPRGERRAGVVLVLAGAALAALLETTAATVTMLPIVAQLGRRARLQPQRLYLIGAIGAMAGGVLTLIGTSGNLVANGVLVALGLPAFGFFELARLGACVVGLGAIYALTAAPWLLPRPGGVALEGAIAALRAYIAEVRIQPGSRLHGSTLREAALRDAGLDVVAIVRGTPGAGPSPLEDPGPDERLMAGDVLLVTGRASDVLGLTAEVTASGGAAATAAVPTAEGLIPPGSPWVGNTLAALHARGSGIRALGIWRHGETLAGRLAGIPLLAGDVLLVRGERHAMAALQEQGHIAWLNPVESGADNGRGRRTLILALAVMASFVAVAATGSVDLALAAFAAATALIVGRCLEAKDAYAAIQWKVLVLLAGVIPLGQAISATGLAAALATALARVGTALGPTAALAALCLAATVLTQVLSNVPATAVLTPVAVRLAAAIGISDKAAVAAILVCVLCTPLSGLASKPTILVREAGGYGTADYLRVGLPFSILAVAAATLLAPHLWPV